MGGIFVNYRRSHFDEVRDLRDRLAEHFGDGQVFFDAASIMPGDRYPDALRKRLEDCEVLLVVIHAGWTDERNEEGARRLHLEGDWVRHEIDQALCTGKTVIPLLLDGAEPPLPGELPDGLRDLAHRQAERLRGLTWRTDMLRLIALLEGRVARNWQPVPAEETARAAPGRWLGAVTAALGVALVCAVLRFAQDGAVPGPGEVPFAFMAAGWSVLVMCAPLATVLFLMALTRLSLDSWERELHSVTHETYVGRTYPVAVGLVLLALFGAFRMRDQGILLSWVVLLVVVLAVARTAAASIRTRKKDQDQWTRWPQALPVPTSRQVLRRSIARLEVRAGLWSSPLTREQRDKAHWVLDDIDRALTGLAAEAKRSRTAWLAQDKPWHLSLYVLWVTANIALTTASTLPSVLAGAGTWRMHVLPVAAAVLSLALALGTMEVAYRTQRRQREALLSEAAGKAELLRSRVRALSAHARAKPSVPAPRTEELREPT
ncbi:toll/interleukin-1 receptor domain-containing protein [Streptomyces sp. NPDC046237]|uniref:toll/interleukin-1 receptor domain-containing protein n=1 Tax=Streptomyces sp. NPDC046237 TaxID=3154914 RepID=UPI0034026248